MPKLTIQLREDWRICHNCKHEFQLATDEALDPEGYLIICPNCKFRWLPEGSYPPDHPCWRASVNTGFILTI